CPRPANGWLPSRSTAPRSLAALARQRGDRPRRSAPRESPGAFPGARLLPRRSPASRPADRESRRASHVRTPQLRVTEGGLPSPPPRLRLGERTWRAASTFLLFVVRTGVYAAPRLKLEHPACLEWRDVRESYRSRRPIRAPDTRDVRHTVVPA